MKWTKEKDEQLKKLIDDGLRINDIMKIMEITFKSISCRMARLTIKVKKRETKEIIVCKNCGNSFECNIFENRVFCNHRCSASFNSKNRKHSKSTKEKISNSLKNNTNKLKNNTRKIVEKPPRKCKYCDDIITEKRKIICSNCKKTYYKYYRPDCEFVFDINNYEDKFDLDLVKKYGWYSPTNKGNNINGVSKDHIYSVKDGFLNKIPPNIIKHPANCQLLKHTDNNIKKTNSEITIGELLTKIENWK